MSWLIRGLRLGAAVALVMWLAPAVQAQDCPAGSVALIGTGSFSTTVEWNLADPGADFAYFAVENPLVNEGRLGDPAGFTNAFFDVTTDPAISEALVQGINIAANTAFGTNGCVLNLSGDRRLIFIFSDSAGSVVLSLGRVPLGNDYEFDVLAPQSTTPSPFAQANGLGDGAVLTKTTGPLTPFVVSAEPGASVRTTIRWQPPTAFTDAPSAPLPVERYVILALQVPHLGDPVRGTSPMMELTDEDGIFTDTTATVVLPTTSGTDTFLFVRCDIANSGGRGVISGPSSRIITDPTLATSGPGRGKGKGLEKAPGQNR